MTHNRTRFGCRFGMPHDLQRLGELSNQIWERCSLCSKTFRWNKGQKGRVENNEYLKAHVRQFAQPTGATKRVFHKVHRPEMTTIIL